MARLIVLEGIDGSGKTTQLALLENEIKPLGLNVRRISFPNYSSDSSAPLRMYLDGKLGKSADDVSAYGASALFAVDRYVSYLADWREDFLRDDTLILTDRYVTSNMIHQGAKLPKEEQYDYIEWLRAFEYGRLALPRPDMVLYLSITAETSRERIGLRNRESGSQSDIHEKDDEYLRDRAAAADNAAAVDNWVVIDAERPRESVTRDILKAVKAVLT